MKTLAALDNTARQQQVALTRIVRQIKSRSRSSSLAQQASDIDAMARSLYLEQWQDIWGSFPQVSSICTACSSVDKSADVSEIISRAQRMNRLARRAAQLLKQAQRGTLSTKDRSLIDATATIYDRFVEHAQDLPRFESACK
jgi:hypothetical protein